MRLSVSVLPLALACGPAPAQTAEQEVSIQDIADATALAARCPRYGLDTDRLVALTSLHRIGVGLRVATRTARNKAEADAARFDGNEEDCNAGWRLFGETGEHAPVARPSVTSGWASLTGSPLASASSRAHGHGGVAHHGPATGETDVTGDPASSHAHRPYEDVAAVLTGTLVVALGITLLAKGGLITGGTAGLALLAGYATGVPFPTVFFLLNLPFYALSVARMGWTLTLRTIVAVALVSGFARFVPEWMTVEAIHPVFAAVAGGTLAGLGLLILFRHRTSLGGVNILALYAQERHGWRAGNVQLGIDVAILAAAVWMIGPERGALSVLAALVLNLVITLNHRPGRYTGVS